MPCFGGRRNAACHLLLEGHLSIVGPQATLRPLLGRWTSGLMMISALRAKLIPGFGKPAAPGRESLRKTLARERAKVKGEIERPRLVLASASPRRLSLLAQVGVTPDALRPSSIDESAERGESPRRLVARLARAKAEASRDQIANDGDIADSYVLAADTIVSVGKKILMKPAHVEEAMASLQLLSGRVHKVFTAVYLITPDDRVRSEIVETKVRFKHLSRSEIEAYIASREWRGKAGGYAIQGLAGSFVKTIDGSYTNVVGLPVSEVVALLNAEGFPIHFNWLKFAEVDRD